MGAYSAICPVYVVEMAPNAQRGFFGCLPEAGIIFGIVITFFSAPSIRYLGLCGLGSALAFLQVVLMIFVPESPTVAIMRARGEPHSDSHVSTESVFQLKYAKCLTTGILALLFQQLCGSSAIVSNLATIMSESGLDVDPCYQAGIAALGQFASVFIGGFIIDRIGRKRDWMLSNIGIVVFLVVYALNVRFHWAVWLPLLSIFCFEVMYDLGLGPIPWFIMPEYFPCEVRSQGTSVATSAAWIFQFTVIFLWPMIIQGMTEFGGILFFAGCTCVSAGFGAKMIYEPQALETMAAVGNEEEDKVSGEDPECPRMDEEHPKEL
jgi:MFS family permease